MKTHFTADTHFGHERILQLATRPFATIEEHDNHLISKINEHVARNDRLFIVGDFCFKDPQKYRMRINCREVILIFGNHDKRTWGHVFSDARDGMMVKCQGLKIWASHYPHAYWDGSHNGAAHVYGHTHDAREETLDKLFPERRSCDVGVDSARRILGEYRPFHEDELVESFLAREGHDQLLYYHFHDTFRRKYQVDADREVIEAPPSLDTRPALRQEVREWRRRIGAKTSRLDS